MQLLWFALYGMAIAPVAAVVREFYGELFSNMSAGCV